jgi:hypothetical protein
MAEEKPDLTEILSRLERVESQNRTLKRGGMVAALLVAMVFIMGQARPNRTLRAESIKADTVDAKVISLRDESGEQQVLLKSTPFPILLIGKQGNQVSLSNGTPGSAAGSALLLDDGENGHVLLSSKDPSLLFFGKSGTASLEVRPEGPSFELKDKEGFEAKIGSASLMTVNTGEKHQTSAASVVLLGKDKKVLWSAP